MYLITFISALWVLSTSNPALAATAGVSDKRGLVYIPKASRTNWPSYLDDDWKKFLTQPSDISWYYNYGPKADDEVTAYSPNTIFVPMLWGLPQSDTDTTFLDTVTAAVKSGQKIDSVLFLNEPDGGQSTGGSSVPAYQAAQLWKTNMEPLKLLNGYNNIVNGSIKLGGPAVTGAPSGLQWLKNFKTACDALGGCDIDFLPAHWYGNFEGLASHIGEKQATFPKWGREIWITEYAIADAGLYDTQDFFNTTAEYFDRLNFTTRYSYFGSFRSSVSNVGLNAAMLDGSGNLTDIGAFYLGRQATGNIPNSQTSGATSSSFQNGVALFLAGLATFWLVF